METCRCGWNGEGEHPCHGNFYQCRKPAKQRFYGFYLPCLAGVQVKVGASDTFACDECWNEFKGERHGNA